MSMNDNNAISPIDTKALSNIFITEQDKEGTDLLSMSNFFDIFAEQINDNLSTQYEWVEVDTISSYFGQILAALKGGFDISKMGILVADSSHFGKDIIEGLKKGIYHIGESKEVYGNKRPAILDDKEHLVKMFTLKQAMDPTEILSDLNNYSTQAMLHHISEQLQDVQQQLDYSIEIQRREYLTTKFINARENVKKAINNPDKSEYFLCEADKYLTEGLTSLYLDLNNEAKKLSKQKSLFGKIKNVDRILRHINEDMLMIPKYVAVQVYLLNCAGRVADAQDVIAQYKYQLSELSRTKLPNCKYTPIELIHELYPYSNDNTDFWLEMPERTIDALESLSGLIEQKETNVFYIEAVTEDTK